jgi:hypothetical protein
MEGDSDNQVLMGQLIEKLLGYFLYPPQASQGNYMARKIIYHSQT